MIRIGIKKLRLIAIVTLIGTCLLFLIVPCSFLICSQYGKKSILLVPYQNFSDEESEKICRYLNFSQTSIKSLIEGSPQFGIEGPYAVVYDYIEREKKFGDDDAVTYSTHCTTEFLKFIEELSVRWDGPISVAVYVPRYDFCSTIAQIVRLRVCAHPSVRQKVSWHLYWSKEFPPILNWRILPIESVDCEKDMLIPSKSWRSKMGLSYPVNVGRNVARQAAKTTYVLPSDVELYPSKDLAVQFVSFIKQYNIELNKNAKLQNNGHQVFVVPVFEIKTVIPDVKEDLVNQIAKGEAVYFHRLVCPHCQKFPGLNKWIHKLGTKNKIHAFSLVKRHYPFHRWEPIFISTKDEPLYDERLSWEGLQDKMSQMHELCLLDYNLIILDRAFLVHSPGIKKKVKKKSNEEDWRKTFINQNARIYDFIMSELQTKHGFNMKCRKH